MSIAELKERLRQRDKQIEEQAARIKEQAARIKELEKDIRELKKLLVEKAQSKESKPPKEASNFSVNRHERKQRKRHRRKKSTGRKPKDAKRDFATETIDLYWHGANRKKCVLRREQFVRLQNELVNHVDKLFVFVLHPEVEPTNNRSEHQVRPEAMARNTARTSKTQAGAKRRGIIMTVLASLSKRMEKFTLGNLLAEINRWIERGQSVFREEVASLRAATAFSSRSPP